MKGRYEIAVELVLGVFPGREIICGQIQKHKKHGGFWELPKVWRGWGEKAFEVAATNESGEGAWESGGLTWS